MSSSMTKKDIVDFVANRNEGFTKKDLTHLYDEVMEAIRHGLLGTAEGMDPKDTDRSVRLPIGTLSVKEVKERTTRHPQTGELIQVPAKLAARFKASQKLKDDLSE